MWVMAFAIEPRTCALTLTGIRRTYSKSKEANASNRLRAAVAFSGRFSLCHRTERGGRHARRMTKYGWFVKLSPLRFPKFPVGGASMEPLTCRAVSPFNAMAITSCARQFN